MEHSSPVLQRSLEVLFAARKLLRDENRAIREDLEKLSVGKNYQHHVPLSDHQAVMAALQASISEHISNIKHWLKLLHVAPKVIDSDDTKDTGGVTDEKKEETEASSNDN